ncbi:MAG TPA: hypothetical protein VMV49_09575 [Candidatus Deferrimicrobium sp.]|nr:hypothetical protein [Candidatus Deferrimicrobium sp.]
MKYYELWFVLWNWRREFTGKEFATVFASPDPNKVLHDMVKKGLLERTGRGNYKVNSPKEYIGKKVNIVEVYGILKESPLEYALTGPDAIFFWTKGGYQVDRFFGFYPIHIKVKEKEVERWREFLTGRNQVVHIEAQPIKETLFGVFFILFPRKEFKIENIDGFKVESLEETIRYGFDKIFSYEPALEMLNEMYNLNLDVAHKETETNM